MMRDSAFLTAMVSSELKASMLQVINSTTDNFAHLVKVSRLDPRQDFRFQNLEGVDFSESDLRGFDFTGSSLKGSLWSNAIFDSTTILDGADLSETVFDTALVADFGFDYESDSTVFRSFMGKPWQDQVIWLDGAGAAGDVRLAQLVYERTSDTFVKRHALSSLARLLPQTDIFDLIQTEAEKARAVPNTKMAQASFHVLRSMADRNLSSVIRFCLSLAQTPWREDAFVFLGEHLQGHHEIRRLSAVVQRDSSAVLRRRYISALAARFGQPVALMLTDPVSGETADFGEVVSPERIELVARAMARRISEEMSRMMVGPFSKEFESYRSSWAHRMRIHQRLEDLNAFGLEFGLPTRETMVTFKPNGR